MSRPLASFLSVVFFVGIAAVLSIPVITSSAELVLRPQKFEGPVGMVSHSVHPFATLDEGATGGVPWSLHVSERPDTLCFSFRTGLTVGDAGLLCTERSVAEVGPSQFIPASDEWRRGVFIAALPGDFEELRLRATDDLPFDGALYKLPSIFETDATVLAVFLPPGADIVSAEATTNDGRRLDMSGL